MTKLQKVESNMQLQGSKRKDQQILAIAFMSVYLLAPTDFEIIWLSNLLTISVLG
jgi:hypothetical protein